MTLPTKNDTPTNGKWDFPAALTPPDITAKIRIDPNFKTLDVFERLDDTLKHTNSPKAVASKTASSSISLFERLKRIFIYGLLVQNAASAQPTRMKTSTFRAETTTPNEHPVITYPGQSMIGESNQISQNSNPIQSLWDFTRTFFSTPAEVKEAQGETETVDPHQAAEADARAMKRLKAVMEAPSLSYDQQPVDVTPSLLLHMLGDFFGLGTRLEGNTHQKILNYTISVLDQMGEFQSDEMRKVRHKLEQALTIHKALVESVDASQAAVAKAFQELPVGESLFIPGGWAGESGHGVYYELIRDDEKYYRFRLYNTGSGLEYHPASVVGSKVNYARTVEIGLITRHRIIDPVFTNLFARKLWLHQHPKTDVKDQDWDPSDIYGGLLILLQGRAIKDRPTVKSLYQPQFSGTCAAMSLKAVLGDALSKGNEASQLYRALEFKAVQEILKNYQKKSLASWMPLTARPAILRLVDKTLEELARNIQETRETGIMGDLEYAYAFKESQKLLQQAAKGHESALQSSSTEPPRLIPVNPSWEVRDLFPIFFPIQDKNPIGYLPHTIIDLHNWTPTHASLATDLEHYVSQLQASLKNESQLSPPGSLWIPNIQNFVELLEKIPFEPTESLEWENLSINDAKAVLHQLAEVYKLYKSASDQLITTKGMDGILDPFVEIPAQRVRIAVLKLATLSHRLLNKIDPFFAKDFENQPNLLSVPVHAVIDILASRDEKMKQTYDPHCDDELQQLQNYWSEQEIQEKYPYLNEVIEYARGTRYGASDHNSASLYRLFTKGEIKRQSLIHQIPTELQRWLRTHDPDFVFPAEDPLSVVCSLADECHMPNSARIPLPSYVSDYKAILQNIFGVNLWQVKDTSDDYIKIDGHQEIKEMKVEEKTDLTTEFSRLNFDSSDLDDLYHSFWYSSLLYDFDKWYQDGRWESRIKATKYLFTRLPQERTILRDQVRLSLEKDRRIDRMIGDSKVQIAETLAYFFSNPDMLHQRDYQRLFKNLLFTPQLLLQELIAAPVGDASRLVNSIGEFLLQQYHRSLSLSNVITGAYLLHLNHLLDKYVAYARRKGVELPTRLPLDTGAETEKLLSQRDLTQIEQTLLHMERALALLTDENITIKQLQFGLASALFTKILYPPDQYLDDEKYRLLAASLRQHSHKLEEICKGEERDRFLNGVVSVLLPHEPPRQWRPSPAFPKFTSIDGEIEIDLIHLNFISKKWSIAILPKEIRNSHSVTRYFKTLPYYVQSVGRNGYEFSHHGQPHRIVSPAYIQAEFSFEGQRSWFQLANLREFNKHIPSWISFYTSGVSEEYMPQIYRLWISGTDPNIILVSGMSSNHPLYMIKITRGKQDRLELRKLDEAGAPTPLLFTELQGYSNSIYRFESRGFVIGWIDESSGRLTRLEFPRFGLSFNVKKTKIGNMSTTDRQNGQIAASMEFPGYWIAPDQFLPQLSGISQYLILENAQGEKKILLAQQQLIKTLDTSSLNIEDAARDQGLISPTQNYFAIDYSIGPDGQSLLKPTTDAARLYLAKIHLWRMDYPAAIKMLRTFNSVTRPYTKQEVEILESIIHHRIHSQDSHPEALAIRLYAEYLRINDLFNFKQNKLDDYLKTFNSILFIVREDLLPEEYERYLTQLENTHQAPLRPHEELTLMNFLFQGKTSLPPIYLHRLMELSKEDCGSLQEAQIAAKFNRTATESFAKRIGDGFMKSSADRVHQYSTYKEARYWGNKQFLDQYYSDEKFLKLYRLITDSTLSMDERQKLFKEATGETLVEENWHRHLSEILDLMVINRPAQENHEKYQALRVVCRYPYLFPSYETMMGFKTMTGQTPLSDYELAEMRASRFKMRILLPAWLYLFLLNPLASPFGISTEKGVIQKAKGKTSTISRLPHVCLPIQTSSIFQATPMPNAAFFNEIPSPERITAAEKEELKKLFVEGQNNVINREIAKVKESIQKAFALEQENPFGYSIPPENEQQWNNYISRLQETRSELQRKSGEIKVQLLFKANRVMPEPVKEMGRVLDMQGRALPEITIDALIQLYWRRNADLFLQANPALTLQDVEELLEGITLYLETATQYQQAQRLLELSECAKNAIKNGIQEEINTAVKDFALAVKAKRAYDVAKYPHFLILEYYLQILIRPDQIENIEGLQKYVGKSEAIAKTLGFTREMIMGSGKSFVLTPLLALLEADGEHLVMCVVPEALLTDTSERLKNTLGTAYDTSIQVLEYDRSTPVTEFHLNHLLRRMERAVGKPTGRKENTAPQIFLTTSSAIQSLYVKYLDHLIKCNDTTDQESKVEMEKMTILFKKIFTLIKSSGKAIVDEADIIFNVRKELHYTLGSKLPLSDTIVQQVIAIYELLLFDPEISNRLKLEFNPSNGSTSFTEEFYRKEIAPKLVRKAWNQLRKNDPRLDRSISNLTPDESQAIETFLASRRNKPAERQVELLKDAVLRNAAALLREQVHELLPLTLDKIANINYAIHPKTFLSIPSHGKDAPAIGSEHGTPFETLNYSIQNLINLSSPFPKEIIVEILGNLKAAALKEMEENQSIELKDTKAYQKARSLFLFQDFSQLLKFEDHLTFLSAQVTSSLELRVKLIKEFLPSRITFFPQTISANPQIFSYLFKHVTGFTGTQWNSDTFPEGIVAESDNTVTGKTLNILWKNKHTLVGTIATSSPKTVARQLFNTAPEATVILDTAGSLRGTKEVDVAKEWLTRAPERYRGVVFYDIKGDYGVKDRKMILSRNSDTPEPLETSPIPVAERLTIYDQEHTTGSDIKQDPNAIAICTINQHTTLRNLLQSVWRLRQLDKGQRVVFVVEEDAINMIINTLEAIEGKPTALDQLTLSEIIRYATYKQGILQTDNNLRAVKQKLKAVVQEELFKVLSDEAIPPETTAKILSSITSAFVMNNIQAPWDLFGISPEEKEKAWVLQPENLYTLIGKEMDQVIKKMAIDPILRQFIDIPHLRVRMGDILKRSEPLLSPKIPLQIDNYGREQENELETEKEAEKEKMKQIELDNYIAREHLTLHPERWVDSHFAAMKDASWRSWLHQFGLSKWISARGVIDEIISGLDSGIPKLELNSLQIVLDRFETLKSFSTFFDASITTSANLAPIIRQHFREPPYEPFGIVQKGISGVAVIEKPIGEYQFVLLDHADLADVREYLNSWIGSNNGKISLYNLDTGFDRSGGCDLKRIEQDPKFIRGIVQAKFFDGRISYTESEIPHLETWLKEQGVEKAEKLFQDHILAWKPDTKARFEVSHLHNIFDTLKNKLTQQ